MLLRRSLPSSTSQQTTTITIEARIPSGISFLMLSEVRGTGRIRVVIPKMSRPLNRFDPVTLPIAISPLPCRAEITLTTNSGVEVPMATIVSPTINSEMLNRRANAAEPSVR